MVMRSSFPSHLRSYSITRGSLVEGFEISRTVLEGVRTPTGPSAPAGDEQYVDRLQDSSSLPPHIIMAAAAAIAFRRLNILENLPTLRCVSD